MCRPRARHHLSRNLSVLPGIVQSNPKPVDVPGVSGDERQTVRRCRGGEERIHRAQPRSVSPAGCRGPAPCIRDASVDVEHSAIEPCREIVLDPDREHPTATTGRHELDSAAQLGERYDAEEVRVGRCARPAEVANRFRPTPDPLPCGRATGDG